jgi:hypothetical protein
MSENDASRIIIEASSMALQIVVPITENPRGITYDHKMLIVRVTGVCSKNHFTAEVVAAT